MTAKLPLPAARKKSDGARVPELDGIRGIAILLVLFSHWGSAAVTSEWAQNLFGVGWVGVDLFFVLSGFLISGILIDSKGSPEYFWRFYIRRAFRILPIYYLYLLLYFHVIPLANHAGSGDLPLRLRSGEAWYWVYLSNWRVDAFRDLRHFWSLAIEEQFYMIWPLVVMLTPRTKLKYVAAFCVMLSPLLRLLFAHRGIPAIYLYQTTPFRLEGLAFGALLAIAARDEQLRGKLNYLARFVWPVTAIIFVFIAVAYGTSPLTGPMTVGGFLCVDILSATAVIRTLRVSGTNGGMAMTLRRPWLTNFGKYSYGLYVWHFPVARRARLMMAGIVSHSTGWLHFALLPGSLIVGIGVSYAIALVSWNFIERPCARLRDQLLAEHTHS